MELKGEKPMSSAAKEFEEFARDCVRLAERADTREAAKAEAREGRKPAPGREVYVSGWCREAKRPRILRRAG